MDTNIEKIYDKIYDPKYLKKPAIISMSPAHVDSLSEQKEEIPKFPYREAAGSILRAATVARPDLSRPVGLLAKWNASTPTRARVRAVMTVLSYMKSTSTHGVTYSPDSELSFIAQYSVGGKGDKVENLSEFNLFSDASWSSTMEDGYSVGGSMMTLYGTPVAWKSKRQTVRADSTCSAEYMAVSETIVWAECWGYIPFFIRKFSGDKLDAGGLPKGCVI